MHKFNRPLSQFVLFLIFHFSNFALATSVADINIFNPDENVWINQIDFKTKSQKYFYVSYSEMGKFFVDSFLISDGKLQELIKRHVFTNLKEQKQFLSKLKLTRLPDQSLLSNKANLVTEVENTFIWKATNEWSTEWETAYANWVENNVDESFFNKYNIATDCADVAVATRWIFSRINSLPIGNTLAGTGTLFTNESMRSSWTDLPTSDTWFNDRLFLTALDYVLNNTYTHSLARDSYPIAVTRDVFTPGVHHLDLYSQETGHTMLVNQIDNLYGGVYLLYSNVPREVRTLWVDYFRNSYGYESFDRGGFLKIRWVKKEQGKWTMLRRSDMPGFSIEQYSEEFLSGIFYQIIEERLGAVGTPEQRLRAGIKMVDDRLKDRVSVVQNGYNFCQENNCEPGSANFDNWSTPSRDRKIRNLFFSLQDETYRDPDLNAIFQDYLSQTLEVTPDYQALPLNQIYYSFLMGSYSSDPRDSILSRWGQWQVLK